MAFCNRGIQSMMSRGRNYTNIIIHSKLTQQFLFMRKPNSWKSGMWFNHLVTDAGYSTYKMTKIILS